MREVPRGIEASFQVSPEGSIRSALGLIKRNPRSEAAVNRISGMGKRDRKKPPAVPQFSLTRKSIGADSSFHFPQRPRGRGLYPDVWKEGGGKVVVRKRWGKSSKEGIKTREDL